MEHIRFRMGENSFTDEELFPHGFAESGEFTYAEEELLVYWGETMYSLEIGDLTPENIEEELFLKVIENPALAHSCLEKVWLKYRALAKYRIPSEEQAVN